jgi:hypothetical protein
VYANVGYAVHGTCDALRDDWRRRCRVRIEGICFCRGHGTDRERHLVPGRLARFYMHRRSAVLLTRRGVGMASGQFVRVSSKTVLVVRVCVFGGGVGVQPRQMTGGPKHGAADQEDHHALHQLSVWKPRMTVKLASPPDTVRLDAADTVLLDASCPS